MGNEKNYSSAKTSLYFLPLSDEDRAMGKRQDLHIDTKGKTREKFGMKIFYISVRVYYWGELWLCGMAVFFLVCVTGDFLSAYSPTLNLFTTVY